MARRGIQRAAHPAIPDAEPQVLEQLWRQGPGSVWDLLAGLREGTVVECLDPDSNGSPLGFTAVGVV